MPGLADKKRLKWRRKFVTQVAEAFKSSPFFLSQCQCDEHAAYKRGYTAALSDLGMFLDSVEKD